MLLLKENDGKLQCLLSTGIVSFHNVYEWRKLKRLVFLVSQNEDCFLLVKIWRGRVQDIITGLTVFSFTTCQGGPKKIKWVSDRHTGKEEEMTGILKRCFQTPIEVLSENAKKWKSLFHFSFCSESFWKWKKTFKNFNQFYRKSLDLVSHSINNNCVESYTLSRI